MKRLFVFILLSGLCACKMLEYVPQARDIKRKPRSGGVIALPAAQRAEDRTKAEARAKVEALAKELGFSLAELIGTEGVKSIRAPVAAKYRHPENEGITWSGRGRRPLWFVAALEAGKSPEHLAV